MPVVYNIIINTLEEITLIDKKFSRLILAIYWILFFLILEARNKGYLSKEIAVILIALLAFIIIVFNALKKE